MKNLDYFNIMFRNIFYFPIKVHYDVIFGNDLDIFNLLRYEVFNN